MEFNDARTDARTQKVPVVLPNGAIVQVEMTRTGREDVAFDVKPFKQVTDALEGIIDAVSSTLQKTQPDKACVKFGLDISIEAGQLTAAIVKGSGKANLEITLEWARQKPEA